MNVDRYAVMGNPVAHSKSPQIHHMFAEQTGQLLRYDTVLVPPGGFASAVREFFDAGGKGLNVTVPFKQEAWKLADDLSPEAARASAVNTLVWQNDGRLSGDNTDGIGLVRDLIDNLHLELQAKRILLLGAGGAARGVLAPLLEQRPAQLAIANRTVERAEQLAEEFSDLGELHGCGFEALEGSAYDLIINATAAGLCGEVPPLPEGIISGNTACYDMVYGAAPTAFVKYARQCGASLAVDGLGMLVEQAAASFRIWRGIQPDTAPVIAALRVQ
ncbi:MAG: shikimate dehydrogenase [Thiogranum sp.]|nr:shikimate dehydrogenase [Thiogranum sp.]